MDEKQKSTGIFGTLTLEERAELLADVGNIMCKLPLISRQCMHVHPFNTYRDYMPIESVDSKINRLAKEYLHDLLASPAMKTSEICRKWFGEDLFAWNPLHDFVDPTRPLY